MDQSTMITIGYVVVFIAIFYFLLIRPQQKQKRERGAMMSALSVGDRIYTVGGIMGTITMIKDNSVWLKVADKVEIQILKSGVGGLQSDETKE